MYRTGPVPTGFANSARNASLYVRSLCTLHPIIVFQTGRPARARPEPRFGPALYGPTLCGPMAFSCRAVSGVVPNWRPKHGPMAHFSGQAGTTPRLARWAATRHGTITGDVEAEAAAPAARGGRRVRSSGTPRRRPARPKLQPPTAYLDRGSRSPIPAAAQGGRATEVRVGGVWRRRPAARGVVVVEAEAGAVGVLAPRGASRRGRISDPRGAPDRERIAGGSALQQHGGSGRGARAGRGGGICRAR
jgi:hypothetical protein